MPLSALSVKNAKKREKPYKLSDERGLYLLVTETGSRLWRLNYRFEGKQKTLALGVYPDVELAAARDRRDAARKLLADGVDPAAVKKRSSQAEGRLAPDSFQTVALDWHAANISRWDSEYSVRIMSRMENDVFPDLGHRAIGDIEAADLLLVIRKIESRGVIDTAKRIKNYCGEVFRYGIAEGKCKTDPSVYVRGALMASKPVKHRARVKLADLPGLLAKVRAYDGDALTRLALQFTILTAVRTIETRYAAWHEFEGLEGPAPLWRIGAERMKMNAEHLVPLPRQAVAILSEIRTLSGGEMLFAADTKSGVISENTMLFALYRLGYHSRQTVHGFRGIFSTVLNETGSFETDWIERQLSHVEEDQVRAAYNSALYLRQRTALLQYWADFIDEQTEIGALVG